MVIENHQQLVVNRQATLARHSSYQLAVYQLPALQLKYTTVPPAVTTSTSVAATAVAADSLMAPHNAQWLATNSHFAVSWRVHISGHPQFFHIMTIHQLDGAGSALCTLEHRDYPWAM